MVSVLIALAALGQGASPAASSRLLTVEGRVEVARAGTPTWTPGVTNLLLANGDRVRTGVRSRATVQLSDRSILRLDELTTVEIRPPQSAGASSGFETKSGASYFFNRERPGAVEFRTPLASGAIRGTEFHLRVLENGRTELALLDGLVDLSNEFGATNLVSGEMAVVDPGRPPRKTAMLDARSIIQWVLYYPAVIDVDELALSDAEKNALADSLSAYRAGDLLVAQSSYPDTRQPVSDAEKIYRAATLLSVGRVEPATQLVQSVSSPLAAALRQLVATVKGQPVSRGTNLTLASEWLAESYALQGQSKLEEALFAAKMAVRESLPSGFALARYAELKFGFGDADGANQLLGQSFAVAPRNAQAHALRGFALAAKGKFREAEEAFDRAIALDPALANGWLGRGLVRIRTSPVLFSFALNERAEAGRQDFQVAATLEPQRSILRSYLGKAWSETRRTDLAGKELRLAQQLDANDPTPWLYSAILAEQQNQVNEAIRDLEHSQELNDNRSIFRSRLLLDQDKAIRSANLARIYQDAGMTDWSVREASRAVSYDYANFSAHQFLANSYEALRDPKQINLRYDAPAVSEYFIANLLAPVGATPLSATVSQQEYTRLFERNHVGIASSTEYFSNGDWVQHGVQYGRAGTTDWALEAIYRTDNGQRPNNELERTDYVVKLRQQVTPQDTVYFEGVRGELESGDVVQYYDQSSANRSLQIREIQNPYLFVGYHREWSPEHHTLALVGSLNDTFGYEARRVSVFEYNHLPNGDPVSTQERVFGQDYHHDLDGWTAELQHIAKLDRHTLVVGGRWQEFDSDARVGLRRPGGLFNLFYTNRFQTRSGDLQRQSVYAYDMWQVAEPFQLTAGLAYDRLEYPRNHDVPPLDRRTAEDSQVSPKAGFIWTPWPETVVRFAYTRSLGGVFADNNVRLEPTSVAGFNQAFRSMIPESVVGSVPGTRFQTFGLGAEQKFGSGTYLSIAGELLESTADRIFGGFTRTNNVFPPAQARPFSPRSKLDYAEHSLVVALNQLIGNNLALGVRYRLTDADLESRVTTVPASVLGPAHTEATLHQVSTYALYNCACGFFAQAEAIWTGQENRGYSPALEDESLFQFNAFAGYRFWRRHAEARLGVLNITDQDYKLNPLTLYNELPRERTFYASFKFYF